MEETLKQFAQEYSSKDMDSINEEREVLSKAYQRLSGDLKYHQDVYDNEKLVQEHNAGQNIAIATLEGKVQDKEDEVNRKKEELESTKEQIQTKLLSDLEKEEEEEIRRIRQKYEKKRSEVENLAIVKSTNSIRSLECATKQLTEMKRKLDLVKKTEMEKLEKRLPRNVIIAKHKIQEMSKDVELIKSKLRILENIHSKKAVKLGY